MLKPGLNFCIKFDKVAILLVFYFLEGSDRLHLQLVKLFLDILQLLVQLFDLLT